MSVVIPFANAHVCNFIDVAKSTETTACQLRSRDIQRMFNVGSLLSLPSFSLSFGLCFLQVTRIFGSDRTKHVRVAIHTVPAKKFPE